MLYGYARVSSKVQLKGHSLEDQIRMLEEHGCAKEHIVDEQHTGKTVNRPKFDKLIHETLQPGDTLMVCKLDRLARNLVEGLNVINELNDKEIQVHVLDLGVIDRSKNGKLIVSILMSISEWEREMILERTAAGKEIARQKPGFREGRPAKFSKEQVELAMSLLDDGYSYTQVTAKTGISRATLVRCRRKQKQTST